MASTFEAPIKKEFLIPLDSLREIAKSVDQSPSQEDKQEPPKKERGQNKNNKRQRERTLISNSQLNQKAGLNFYIDNSFMIYTQKI